MKVRDALPPSWFIAIVSRVPRNDLGYASEGDTEYILQAEDGRVLGLGEDGKLVFTDTPLDQLPEYKGSIVCEPDLTQPGQHVSRWGLYEQAEQLLASSSPARP